MKRALITGVGGQDGSYLAEFLAARGYAVLGTGRSTSKRSLPTLAASRVEWLTWDLRDDRILADAISAFAPDEIYNLAALSSGAGMFDSPLDMADVNGLAVARILVAIERSGRPIRFCQASSSETFGTAVTTPQNERTGPHPRTPYGAAKLYADAMVQVYRRARGVFACSAILFNHESPRRGAAFVTSKVSRAAARISLGLEADLQLETLAPRRDWGHARDYVEAMWLMLQLPEPDDFVLATGETHSVGELCSIAFSAVGLRYEEFVRVSQSSTRSAEGAQLVGDASKARRLLGWSPRTSFDDMIREMVLAELDRARSANLDRLA